MSKKEWGNKEYKKVAEREEKDQNDVGETDEAIIERHWKMENEKIETSERWSDRSESYVSNISY